MQVTDRQMTLGYLPTYMSHEPFGLWDNYLVYTIWIAHFRKVYYESTTLWWEPTNTNQTSESHA